MGEAAEAGDDVAVRHRVAVSVVGLGEGGERPAKSAAHVLPGCKIYVPLAEHIDFDAEIAKQEKKLADLEKRRETRAQPPQKQSLLKELYGDDA